MTRRVPLRDNQGPKFRPREYLHPGFAWARLTLNARYFSLRLWCLLVGHQDAQHWRELCVNGDEIFSDENVWCSRCGTDAA